MEKFKLPRGLIIVILSQQEKMKVLILTLIKLLNKFYPQIQL